MITRLDFTDFITHCRTHAHLHSCKIFEITLSYECFFKMLMQTIEASSYDFCSDNAGKAYKFLLEACFHMSTSPVSHHFPRPHVCYYVKSTAKNHCNCPDILWIWDTFWSIPPNSLFMVIRIQCRTVLKSVSNVTMSHLHQDYWHWRESQDDNDRLRLGMFWFAVSDLAMQHFQDCHNVKTCQSFPPPPQRNILKLHGCCLRSIITAALMFTEFDKLQYCKLVRTFFFCENFFNQLSQSFIITA